MKARYFLIPLLVMMFVVMTVWSMILYSDAVIAWWIIPAVGLGIGLASGLHLWRLWRRVTDTQGMAWNYLCHSVFTAAFVTWVFFTVNNLLADRDTERVMHGVVSAHFREERHRTRRVGRRYVSTGEKYYVYKLEVELSDGQRKKLDVSYGRYKNVRNGDSVTVPVCDGLLGVMVMETDSLKYKTRPKAKRKSRLKYFGRKPKE